MKMTFRTSADHEVELIKQDDGIVKALSRYRVSGDLWMHCFKDFGSIEEAITFYQIKF